MRGQKQLDAIQGQILNLVLTPVKAISTPLFAVALLFLCISCLLPTQLCIGVIIGIVWHRQIKTLAKSWHAHVHQKVTTASSRGDQARTNTSTAVGEKDNSTLLRNASSRQAASIADHSRRTVQVFGGGGKLDATRRISFAIVWQTLWYCNHMIRLLYLTTRCVGNFIFSRGATPFSSSPSNKTLLLPAAKQTTNTKILPTQRRHHDARIAHDVVVVPSSRDGASRERQRRH
jgi:hypothetical protein